MARTWNQDYEQLISFHPSFKKLGDQPTIRDLVFDHFCNIYTQQHDKANEETKKYLDELFQVFCNQRRSNG